MSDAAARNDDAPEAPVTTGRSRKLLWFGIFIAAVLIGVIFALAYGNVSENKRKMEVDTLDRQKTVTDSRAQSAESWLQTQLDMILLFTRADIIQMYAAELDKRPDSTPVMPGGAVKSSGDSSFVELMGKYLADLVDKGFASGRIVTSKGELYISTEAQMKPLTEEERQLVGTVVRTGDNAYGPLTLQEKGISFSMFLPILPPEYQREGKRPVAVLILNFPMSSKLAEVLSSGPVAEKGRTLRLVEMTGDRIQCVSPGAIIVKNASEFPLQDGKLAFGRRASYGGKEMVYSSGSKVRGLNWWIVSEYDAASLEGQLAESAQRIYILAGVLAVALVLLISAMWWWLVGREQGAINDQIRELLVTIENQQKLLNGINSAISDPISLTDGKGVYKYVNKAFAQAVGRSEEDVPGLDAPAVFGFDTARRLNASDQHVLMTGESISVNEVLWLQSRRYHFQISKTPLKEPGSRSTQGIVSVFRDITQLVETEERSRRMVQQTIDALVRAIEEADPFLGGHSRIMGGMASLMARQLRLEPNDVATIEAAANLSQIGKMFVPREILLKPGALTPEEKREMERHVEYARNVLKDIEFDLPVVSAIYQMNERLDGKGYPKGLSGDEISMHARVLAVANAFAAMAKPRSYRPALPVNEVLAILEKQKDSYDPEVVACLRQVINTPAGEKIVAHAAASKAL